MERSKRNKSRQSNKSRDRLNENGSSNQSTSNFDQSGQNQQNSGGGLVRSKPCREIYRPPNVRSKGRNNNSNQSNQPNHYQNFYSYNNSNSNNGNLEHIASNGGHHQVTEKSSPTQAPAFSPSQSTMNEISTPLSPMSGSCPSQGFRPLNIHAKEFHFKPSTGDEFSSSEFQETTTPFYGIVSTIGIGTTVQSQPQNFYSICQSKSSGDLISMRQQAEQQYQSGNAYIMTSQSQFQQYFNNHDSNYSERTNCAMRLQQSKSSGNIPGRNKVVRFVDEDESQDQKQGSGSGLDHLLNLTKSMNIGGGKNSNFEAVPLGIPQPRVPFLQKSRTTIQMGVGSNNMNSHGSPSLINSQMNQFPNYNYRNSSYQRPISTPSSVVPNTIFLPAEGLIQSQSQIQSSTGAPLKRSKSFTMKSQLQNHNQNCKSFGDLNPRIAVPSGQGFNAIPPNFGDFCISKWPKSIQELITSSVTGGDRIPPRHRISMVTSIFETLFDNSSNNNNSIVKGSTEVENGQSRNFERNNEIASDLTVPAVKIFLYFIQREKDHTVMESLLNTCFAIFQSLLKEYGLSHESDTKSQNTTRNKWSVFLSFLCSLYCQLKVIRIQQSMGSSADQISGTILTLLCDSCLATLRSLPICHTPETMDCLFTVMTSIGRDIEKTYPSKMKQILTSVRDALLGLGHYSTLTEAPAGVQKTLMQLIELHAANWHLPASAVRYYYAHPTPTPSQNTGSGNLSEQTTQNCQNR